MASLTSVVVVLSIVSSARAYYNNGYGYNNGIGGGGIGGLVVGILFLLALCVLLSLCMRKRRARGVSTFPAYNGTSMGFMGGKSRNRGAVNNTNNGVNTTSGAGFGGALGAQEAGYGGYNQNNAMPTSNAHNGSYNTPTGGTEYVPNNAAAPPPAYGKNEQSQHAAYAPPPGAPPAAHTAEPRY